ncbi:hypothetical protein RintRC_3161 [Richelia intracellularis]|nr:hypothetical protein RintRC_3161 [Richelia intracellularis]
MVQAPAVRVRTIQTANGKGSVFIPKNTRDKAGDQFCINKIENMAIIANPIIKRFVAMESES